jgi:beta-lactamase class A
MEARPASLLRHRCLEVIRAARPAVVAVAALDLDTGDRVDVEAGRIFHGASMIKLAILVEVYRQADDGQLSLDEPVSVHNQFPSAATTDPFAVETDTDAELHDAVGQEVTVADLAQRMITVSSNLAANLLLEKVGRESVQGTIVRLGAGGMTIRRFVEDLEAYDAGVVNTTTAGAVAALLQRLAEGRAVNPAVDRQMVELLRGQTFTDGLPARLPETATVAHKTGWTSTVQHDAGIVETAGRAPYVLSICTKGFDEGEEAKSVIAQLAELVHSVWR